MKVWGTKKNVDSNKNILFERWDCTYFGQPHFKSVQAYYNRIKIHLSVLPETYPACNFDLKVGISEFVEHIPHQHGIDALLRWILRNKTKLYTPDKTK